MTSLKPICPTVDARLDQQHVLGVEICHWLSDFPETSAADVVIEAFACDLPENYLQAMCRRPVPPVWINLEYLSAENWVEDCHTLTSPHPALPLTKHFFFPGFGERTGGLIMEDGLLQTRDTFQAALPARERLEISLFCYENAPVGALFSTWAEGERPIRCRVPPGQPLRAAASHFGDDGPWQCGNLRVEPIPFLPQPDYDHLLWSCDLNFVRGEDSFVRAQWAGHPFVWQAYRQQGDAHLPKVDAFLQRYVEDLPIPIGKTASEFFRAWNLSSPQVANLWPVFLDIFPQLKAHNQHWAKQIAEHSLVKNLVNFCLGKL